MTEHYRRLERMYLASPANQKFQDLAIDISTGCAEVAFDVTPELCHAAGGMHGCYYFKVLDDAAFFAANSLVEDVFVLTADFMVQFFLPVSTGRVTAVGTITKPGRNLLFADAVVNDQEGNEVARGRGSFTRSAMPFDGIALYR